MWAPTVKVEVVKVATPLPFSAVGPPIGVPAAQVPSFRVTLPTGVSTAGASGVTVTVNVTVWLNTEGLALDETAVEVSALFTACETLPSLGSKFGMSMRSRPESLFLPYRTTNTVVEFEPDRRIAWKTTIGPGGLIGGRIWRYELEPVDGGTLVRESWDVSEDRQRPMLKLGSMPRQAEDGMRATLERIAALVEP